MERVYHKSKNQLDPRYFAYLESVPPSQEIDKKVVLKDIETIMLPVIFQYLGPPPDGTPEGKLYTIKGIDGNDIAIKVYRPSSPNTGERLPCLIYCHGGGMACFSINDYDTVYRIFASFGIITIAVDFRNSTVLPFPAGLHDCLSAVIWTSEHADELQIDKEKLVIGGESGGGNLAAATCLLAKEKNISVIKGQYLNCPFISPYDNHPSSTLYNGYSLPPNLIKIVAAAYTPPEQFNNHIAWPSNAQVDQLRGLPPTLLVTNEFDILVDEGERYRENLAQAGVRVTGVRILGSIHGSSIMNALTPDVVGTSCGMLVGWMKTLGKK